MPHGRIQELHCSSGEQADIKVVQLSQLPLLHPHHHVISLPVLLLLMGLAAVVEPESLETGQADGSYQVTGFYTSKSVNDQTSSYKAFNLRYFIQQPKAS